MISVIEVGIWISGSTSSRSSRAFELKTPDCLKGKRPLFQRTLTFDPWPHQCINLYVVAKKEERTARAKDMTWDETTWENKHAVARPHWSDAYQYILLDKVLQTSEAYQVQLMKQCHSNRLNLKLPLCLDTLEGSHCKHTLRSVFMCEGVCNSSLNVIRYKFTLLELFKTVCANQIRWTNGKKSKSSEVK